MALTNDLISQFAKITNDKPEKKTETIVYGTTAMDERGNLCVKLDGSEITTPVTSTTNNGVGERVMVMIKNHTATITGNITEPSGKAIDVSTNAGRIGYLEADNVEIKNNLVTANAKIGDLEVDNVDIREKLNAANARIDEIDAGTITAEEVQAINAGIEKLKTDKLDAKVAEATYAAIKDLEATDAKINNLNATYGEFASLTANKFEAINASFENLNTEYATIDFSNIGKAAMEYFYANSGLIENVVVGDGTISGNLVGVTIKGDVIEGNTVVADKLVIQGEDGLYYKLNTDGVTVEGEQTEYNSLNGSIITAKSITATQIAVTDLVAFDATIGGFNITDKSIYSEVKDSENNMLRGIYMDTDGQFNFGDADNFIKYYKDQNGNYKLIISAESIMYSLNGSPHSIADIGLLGEYINIGTYEGEPCIELGESDSDFKLVITNTRILFMEGNNVPAYITNQSLHIEKAVIEEELQQGGFVWKARSNGNLGLIWKG